MNPLRKFEVSPPAPPPDGMSPIERREFLRQHGLRMYDIARFLGVSSSAVSRLLYDDPAASDEFLRQSVPTSPYAQAVALLSEAKRVLQLWKDADEHPGRDGGLNAWEELDDYSIIGRDSLLPLLENVP